MAGVTGSSPVMPINIWQKIVFKRLFFYNPYSLLQSTKTMDKENNYAIILSGGKQYRVREGDVIKVELLDAENATVDFDKVLMVRTQEQSEIGTPYLENRHVEGKVLANIRGKKSVALNSNGASLICVSMDTARITYK